MIVTNTTYQLAPWADALFAMDEKWWREYWVDVAEKFKGRRYTVCSQAARYGVQRAMNGEAVMQAYGNSGAGAIMLAATYGASRIVLLGYDCQRTGGRAHWHGDHPSSLGNAGSLPRWQQQFNELRQRIQRVEIINCSRSTALKVFPRQTLEETL